MSFFYKNKRLFVPLVAAIFAVALLMIPPTAKAATTATGICNQLFANDDTNIFKEVICSFTRVVALSVSNLSTEMTCLVQKVGNGTNYVEDIDFTSSGVQCSASSSLSSNQDDTPFGSTQKNNKISFTNPSALTKNLDPTNTSGAAKTFKTIRGIVALLAVAALFFFAFANIFHIDVNTYAIKKAIPSIAIAIVGGWLSIYIVYLLSRLADFSFSLGLTAPNNALHPMLKIFESSFSSLSSANTTDQSVSLIFDMGAKFLGGSGSVSFFSGILGIAMLTIPALAIFAFEYVLALRAFAVEILAIIAPIAFGCLVLPQTQSFFRKWWSYLLIAIFYAPLANFLFYLANQVTPSDSDILLFVSAWILKTAIIVLLIRLPFTIEADTKRLISSLAKTSFGTALGLNKIAGRAETNLRQNRTDARGAGLDQNKVLSERGAAQVIAPTKPGLARLSVLNNTRPKIKLGAAVSGITPSIRQAVTSAAQENARRGNNLLVKSSSDISPDTFRAIIDQSDLKLWKDTRSIDRLKNQNGQILNEQGAALRADSARKLLRLSQIIDNDKIANPEALKVLAEKGILDNVPMSIIKKALDEGILQKNDLVPTFKKNTEKVFEQIIKNQSGTAGFLNSDQAKKLMAKDQTDYATGFKDLTKLFADTIRDPSIIPPPPPPVIKNIINQMQSTEADTFDKNGMYFLSRLAEIKDGANKEITSVLSKGGVPAQTALAISRNPNIDFEQARKYLKDGSDQETLMFLREGFLNRDLSNSLTDSIASLIREQKTLVAEGVSQKISETLSRDNTGLTLNKIKDSMIEATKKLEGPVTPQEAEEISKQVDQYYPGATIKANGVFSQENIVQTVEKAKNISQTVEQLIKSGVDENSLKTDPAKAQQQIEQTVEQDIQKAMNGQIASDKAFDSQLEEISASAPSSKSIAKIIDQKGSAR